MAGRNKKFDEQEVLGLALDVFWSQGYEATTLDDLLIAMDLKKGSFYHAFGSKKQLFKRALDVFFNNILTTLKEQFESTRDPTKVIRGFYANMCVPSNSGDFKKGCLLSNTITEFSLVDNELEKYASNKITELEELFTQALSTAQHNKMLNPKIDVQLLSKQFINFWHGIHVTMRIHQQPETLKKLVDDFFDMALNKG